MSWNVISCILKTWKKHIHDIMKRHLGDSYLFINSVEHTGDIMKRHLSDNYLFINSVKNTGDIMKWHLGDSYLFINSVEHDSNVMKQHLCDSYLFYQINRTHRWHHEMALRWQLFVYQLRRAHRCSSRKKNKHYNTSFLVEVDQCRWVFFIIICISNCCWIFGTGQLQVGDRFTHIFGYELWKPYCYYEM